MYQKEIIYVGLYKAGSRVGSAGFLKVESRDRESRMHLKIQNMPPSISGRFPVRIYNGNDWKELSGVAIQDGVGNWQEIVPENVDRTIFLVTLSDEYTLEGRSKSATEISAQQPIEKNTDQASETIIVTEELPRLSQENIDIIPQSMTGYSLKEDKWEQILDTYEQIHPYGDERVYVKLEPKDFVILQSQYQHLVNNSFLLHGFYNYRYIILGKEQDYYLGVPGVFYEREKMVAQMFGFEAFECPGGNVRAGEFGYYLRKVEL